jgi:hypothetical protein
MLHSVYRVEDLVGSKRNLGHASNLENAILIVRPDAGDSIVKSTRFRD